MQKDFFTRLFQRLISNTMRLIPNTMRFIPNTMRLIHNTMRLIPPNRPSRCSPGGLWE